MCQVKKWMRKFSLLQDDQNLINQQKIHPITTFPQSHFSLISQTKPTTPLLPLFMHQFSINLLLLTSSLLGMYLYMSWTTQQSWNSIINFLYTQNTTASLNQQFEIMVTTGYYLVLVFIFGSVMLQLYKAIVGKKHPHEDIQVNTIVRTVYDSFKNTFYEFITFLCLYFYFIRNHDDEVSERQLILIPFWYLTARVLYIVGYLLTTISGVNLKHYGITLTIFTYAVMLGKSFGYNLFLYL